MKRFLQYIFGLMVALPTLVSCETDVVFNGEDMASLPVLYSVVSPDEPVRAYYSRSVFILDDRDTTNIEDGVVELYVNDVFCERLEVVTDEVYETGERRVYYQGTTIVNPSDRVLVRARCSEFPEWVSGSTVVPEPINVGEFVVTLGKSSEEDRVAGSATLPISDPEGENFYWLESSYFVTTNPGIPYAGYSYPMNYTDVAFSSGRTSDILMDLINDAPDYVIFDDVLIEGMDNYVLTMEWDFGEVYVQNPVIFELKCCQLDKNLYKYYLSTRLAEETQMFGEPVQIHTNIEGGLGLVGSRSATATRELLYHETEK